LLDDQRLGRNEPNIVIISVDYLPDFQQIASPNPTQSRPGTTVYALLTAEILEVKSV
jgi:hypothetical protein